MISARVVNLNARLIVIVLVAVLSLAIKAIAQQPTNSPPLVTQTSSVQAVTVPTLAPLTSAPTPQISVETLLQQANNLSQSTFNIVNNVLFLLVTGIVASGIAGSVFAYRRGHLLDSEIREYRNELKTMHEPLNKKFEALNVNFEELQKAFSLSQSTQKSELEGYVKDLGTLKDSRDKEITDFKLQITENRDLVTANGKAAEEKLLTLSKDIVDAQNLAEALAISLKKFKYLAEVNDQNKDVRLRAVNLLGTLNDISVSSTLINRLLQDGWYRIRIEAASSLGELLQHGGNEPDTYARSFRALLRATKDKDSGVRAAAAYALNRIYKNDYHYFYYDIQIRFKEMVDYDVEESVKAAAQVALTNIEQKRQQHNAGIPN